MYSNERKINKIFQYWLFASLILVFSIIIVGGLTRLTDSGLSITEWELFKGLLPPLSENSWIEYFEEYKKIPQYQLLNSNMTINEFKVIFYWEYFHRILARFIGLFFLLPLIYFYFSKKIRSDYINICFLISLLIVLQGVIGWFMVKSGLVNNTSVSHYRLSVHLITAIIIISSIYWLIMNIKTKQNKIFFKFTNQNLPFQILILLILFQIIMGAFVSGLDAGKIYQTWPLMGANYLPDDYSFVNFQSLLKLDNHSLVQFYHRNLAYLIIIYVIFLSIFIYRKKLQKLYFSMKVLLLFLLFQVILGISTLITGLNIYLASAHQITSVLLAFSALNLYYFRAK
tara:strand:+ start:287 stop:1312 length:1026 start_codon:yes stop_codon:yes gene_type:complete